MRSWLSLAAVLGGGSRDRLGGSFRLPELPPGAAAVEPTKTPETIRPAAGTPERRAAADRAATVETHDRKVDVDARKTGKKPNILVIMPDDVGYWNISAYNRGVMGYRTPNIDRLAEEGALFSDQYAQPSCTPGRASF